MFRATRADSDPGAPGERRAFVWAALALFAASLILTTWQLWGTPLADWDEALTGVRARSLLRTGNWLTVEVNREPDFHKPPFLYWLVALSQLVLGDDEFAVRLPGTLAATALVLLVFAIGRDAAGLRGGFLAAAVLLTFPFFEERARHPNPDMVFLAASLAAVLAFLRERYVGAGVLVGLALLTKGMAGMLAPTILAVRAILTLDARFLRRRGFWLGSLAAASVVLPWIVWNAIHHGDVFQSTFFGDESASRIRWPPPWRRLAGYYAGAARDTLSPAVWIAPLWLVAVVWRLSRAESWSRHAVVPAMFIAATFSMSLIWPPDGHYLSLLMAPAALMVGIAVATFAERGFPAGGVALAAIGLGTPFLLASFADFPGWKALPDTALIALLGIGWLVVARGGPPRLALVAPWILLLSAATTPGRTDAVSASLRNYGLREMATVIRETVPPDEVLLTDREIFQAAEYYTDRRIEHVGDFFRRSRPVLPSRVFLISDSDLHEGIAGYRVTGLSRVGRSVFVRLDHDDERPAPAGIRLIARRDDSLHAEAVKLLGAAYETLDRNNYRNWVLKTDRLDLPPYLSRKGWVLSSPESVGDPSHAVDGNPTTAWTVGRSQRPGLAIEVDLSRMTSIHGVRLLTNERRGFPHGLAIEASTDGSRWRGLLEAGTFHPGYHLTDGELRYDRDYSVRARFRPAVARYLRLSVTEGTSGSAWAIAELDVRGTDAPGIPGGVDGEASGTPNTESDATDQS